MFTKQRQAMFYGASPRLFEFAKVLRENMTESELSVWELLKNNRMLNLRFKSQHPIYKFIADFYCHKLQLVIEIDGGIHNIIEHKEYDVGKDFELNNLGIKVLRFTNSEVDSDIESVRREIEVVCSSLLSKFVELNEKTPNL